MKKLSTEKLREIVKLAVTNTTHMEESTPNYWRPLMLTTQGLSENCGYKRYDKVTGWDDCYACGKKILLSDLKAELIKREGYGDFIAAAAKALKASRTKESTAIETLDKLGYTWNGGELWKPPMGNAPTFAKTKVTYEKVRFDKLSEAFAEHEKSPLRSHAKAGHFLNDVGVVSAFSVGCDFYRKVETEITRDEFDAMELCRIRCECFGGINFNKESWDNLGEDYKEMYRKMAKLVSIKK